MDAQLEIRHVSFVGSGNVATHLARALQKAEIEIDGVFSPTASHAMEFSKAFNCRLVHDIHDLSSGTDLILLCVPDNQVAATAHAIAPGRAIVAHTSGIVNLSQISTISHPTGVFYPLQTFSKQREVSFTDIPFCIEASDQHTKEALTQLAYLLSNRVAEISSEDRALLHLTAVMVNNFTNRLYGMAHEILTENNLDFNLLVPLIRETALKVAQMPPHQAQTGPARRKDEITLMRHRELLKDFPHYQQLYQLLTDQIIKIYHE